MLLASPALGGEVRFYGSRGDFQGTAEMQGDTTRFYAADGTYQGEARTSGDTTRLYGRNGEFQGEARGRSPETARDLGRRQLLDGNRPSR